MAERLPYSYENQVIPQVGLLYSNYDWKRIPVGCIRVTHSRPLKEP